MELNRIEALKVLNNHYSSYGKIEFGESMGETCLPKSYKKKYARAEKVIFTCNGEGMGMATRLIPKKGVPKYDVEVVTLFKEFVFRGIFGA